MGPQSHYHVFSLPPELLETLTPRNLVNKSPPRSSSPQPQANTAITPSDASGGRSCNVCLGAAFRDVDEQRSHFRSDWHRYNVKLRLRGGNPVSEADFSRLVESLDDSLSGSASSSDDDDISENDSDAVSTLMDKRMHIERPDSPTTASPSKPQTALAWFHSPPSTQIGVYRLLFPLSTPTTSYLSELKGMQSPREEGRTWAMFMVAGGHFAGAIVRVQRPDGEDDDDGKTKKGKPKKPKPDTEVLKHKTFHRYTTRRKQGGSQSVNDKSKGNAISAGATLRRYGEQALRDDIRNLLADWADEVDNCERIWIRANVSNRRIFLDYEGAVISKGDERLRTFPFPTRRPTQAELSRCLLELTKVKTSYFTEEELREQDEAYIASLPKPRPQPAPAAPPPPPEKEKQARLTKEQELLRDKWARLLEMVQKGRLEPLKAFWEREESSVGGVNTSIPDWTGEKRVTLLQVAAASGHEEVTRWLLEDVRADPTVEVPTGQADDEGQESDASDAPLKAPSGSRRTAYDLARSKAVRDVFRRCAADHPDWWDWLGAARVPSALSKEMEEDREEKKKVRRKGLKDKVRERQAREQEKERQTPPLPPPVTEEPKTKNAPKPNDPSGPRKLGGTTGATEGVAGLTPEMRARVERERRARAAEARLKALGGR